MKVTNESRKSIAMQVRLSERKLAKKAGRSESMREVFAIIHFAPFSMQDSNNNH